MSFLQLVFKQMRQRALSTWLTMLSVVLGVALATAVMIVHRGGGALFGQTEFGYDIIVGPPKGSSLQLVLNTVYQIDFPAGVVPYAVYEDLAARDALQAAWDVTADQARSYAEQGLGMVQLTIWLALTAEGLATSLQHLEWLCEDLAAAFLELPAERYRLVATMPIGYADEVPPASGRRDLDGVVSFDRFVP